MRGLACVFALAACSMPTQPMGDNCGTQGPLVTITTVNNEQLFGSARIYATEAMDGSGSLYIDVCGKNGDRDEWRLLVQATSDADAQAPPPLPLTQSDQIVFPSQWAIMQAWLRGTTVSATQFTGHLTAAHGQLQGSVTWGTDGATATFDGGYTFECDTNHPDPYFKTTFCQQFIGLAP